MAVVFADPVFPDDLAALRVGGEHDPGLARGDDQFAPTGLHQDRRALEVPVVDVVRGDLVVPLELAGLGVQLDQRVAVEIGAGAARAEGVFAGAGERRRVAGAEVHAALAVEGGRVPGAAARVDRRLAPEALGHGVEVPELLAGLRFERPHRADAAAFVGLFGVDRHGRDEDLAFAEARRHVDALVFVAGQLRRPDLFAVLLVEGEGFGRGAAVDAAVGDDDPVRPVARDFEARGPEHFARFEVDRLHVGGEVLRVDHALVDHRSRGVAAEVACAGDLRRPGFGEAGDVGAVDRLFGLRVLATSTPG